MPSHSHNHTMVPTAAAVDGRDPLAILRTQPEFLQIRRLMHHSLEFLNAALQQFGLTNPALLQLISENEDSFLNMLNEPASPTAGSVGAAPDLTPIGTRSGRITVPTAAAGDGSDPLAILLTQPEFLQIRSLMQQTLEFLNAALQQFGQPNPALLQLISENKDSFLNMLNEPTDGGDSASETGNNNEAGPDDGIGVADSLMTSTGLQMTPQDREFIERLQILGFPEHLVLQAYFACERNVHLAANFLLSQNLYD